MKIAGIAKDSIVDGPGIRFTVFTQGCSHNCPGCHNPHTHDFKGGHDKPIYEIIEELKSDKLAEGVTLSGGDPFDQPHACTELAAEVKKLGYSLWCYTGYTFEKILEANTFSWNNLLSYIDVLVDGPFIESQKSYNLKFRGSKNQRIIDVVESLKQHKAVEYQFESDVLEKFQIPD